MVIVGNWGEEEMGEGLEKLGRRRTGEEVRQTQREEGHREERHREEACPLSWDLETLSQSQRASVLVPIKINAI